MIVGFECSSLTVNTQKANAYSPCTSCWTFEFTYRLKILNLAPKKIKKKDMNLKFYPKVRD